MKQFGLGAMWKMSLLQVALLRLIRSSRGFDPSGRIGMHSRIARGSGCQLSRNIHIRTASTRPPPDYSIIDDDEDDDKMSSPVSSPAATNFDSVPDFTIEFDDQGKVAVNANKKTSPRPQFSTSTNRRVARQSREVSPNASWSERQNAFTKSDGPRTFREDFRGTRVFVQGIPAFASWQDLKDHFRIAGEVVFASISEGKTDAESKKCGIVQFENTDMAQRAIQIMKDHPLDGHTLFVRKDIQNEKSGASLQEKAARVKGPTPPTKWKCANEEDASQLSDKEQTTIRMLIKERDFARRKKDYDLSDEIRDQLKNQHSVHIDDRLKMWWLSSDGKNVPQTIQDIKGDGRWTLKAWRMIPTSPENDACVDPDLVNGLLAQRDIARREKDFDTADSLLEEARDAPDGDLYLRIHDESRTWRIWSDEPPVFATPNVSPTTRKSPAEQCIEITEQFAPHRVEEVQRLLQQFPGREYSILKKLKRQFEV
jgi:RNA recognition motif-containing protein